MTQKNTVIEYPTGLSAIPYASFLQIEKYSYDEAQKNVAKSFNDADEVKNPPKAKVQVVKLGNVNASKLVLEPGWRWSECIKPTVGGDSCQAGHVGVVISGRLACTHDDGSKIEVGPGDAYYFAPGHDGWVVGDEQCVMYEIVEGGKDFGPWKHAH